MAVQFIEFGVSFTGIVLKREVVDENRRSQRMTNRQKFKKDCER